MSAIIPFQFEAHAVRVQVDDAGLPWFNACLLYTSDAADDLYTV